MIITVTTEKDEIYQSRMDRDMTLEDFKALLSTEVG